MMVQKSYIDNNGRLTIPIKVRKKLKLKTGDEVTIKYNDSELIVSTFHSNIEKARNILDKYKNIDLNKELKLMRKYDSDVIPAGTSHGVTGENDPREQCLCRNDIKV